MNDTKSDPELGKRIYLALLEAGVETPMTSMVKIPMEEKRVIIEKSFLTILQTLGLDTADDSLMETPKRMAKMYLQEIYKGLDYDNFPKCTVVDNKFRYDEMLLERKIMVHSTCEHHGLPIEGFAHIAYIPDKKVLGLSKLNRIVDFFSRRPQIQERLTEQIHHALCDILETKNVAVCIAAEHMCVKTRGIQDACSDTVSSRLGGAFKDKPSVRAEFYSLIKL